MPPNELSDRRPTRGPDRKWRVRIPAQRRAEKRAAVRLQRLVRRFKAHDPNSKISGQLSHPSEEPGGLDAVQVSAISALSAFCGKTKSYNHKERKDRKEPLNLPPNDQRERRETAATGIRIQTERNGCLSFARRFGWARPWVGQSAITSVPGL